MHGSAAPLQRGPRARVLCLTPPLAVAAAASDLHDRRVVVMHLHRAALILTPSPSLRLLFPRPSRTCLSTRRRCSSMTTTLPGVMVVRGRSSVSGDGRCRGRRRQQLRCNGKSGKDIITYGAAGAAPPALTLSPMSSRMRLLLGNVAEIQNFLRITKINLWSNLAPRGRGVHLHTIVDR